MRAVVFLASAERHLKREALNASNLKTSTRRSEVSLLGGHPAEESNNETTLKDKQRKVDALFCPFFVVVKFG